MNNSYTPEFIEAYLENKLSAAEKASFESAVSKDPLLQNEVTLQNDIAEAIKQHRKAQLKSRLDQIPVSMNPSYTGIKIAASIVASGLIVFGAYWMFNSNNKSSKEETVSVTTSPSNSNNNQVTIQQEKVVETKTPEITENTQPVIVKEKTPTRTRTERRVNQEQVANEEIIDIKAPEHHSPDLMELGHDQYVIGHNSTLPEGKVGQQTETKSGPEINIDNSTKNKFHYKYHDNKIFLFGDFESKTYSILELNPEKGGKQLYLHFNNQYYQLKPNQLEITNLSPVTDKKTIESLNKFNK